MFRTELTNGITLWYGPDSCGELVLIYPDGAQVHTTWSRLGRIEALMENLRDAYEYLLAGAGTGDADAGPPVDKLVQLDDLLFELRRRPARGVAAREKSPGTTTRSTVLDPPSRRV